MPDMLQLQPVLQSLQSVSDDDLRTGLQTLNLRIPESKLAVAFSAYGLTNFLSGASLNDIRSNVVGIPDEQVNAIRLRGVFVFRAYVTFCYMRSDHLESGLDGVGDASPLNPFRSFFRKGEKAQTTIAQHIRNSLAHGTFDLSEDFKCVEFIDRKWRAKLGAEDFVDGLCKEVFRFYAAALHAQRP